MDIPLADLKAQYETIKQEVDVAIGRVIDTTAFINGPDVADFEREFADYCNKKYTVGVSSGTEALRLALIASGVSASDEVITVPNTFIATAEAITAIGSKIRFVDVDEKTFNIDTQKINDAIALNTKAIIPVHLYGQPADMGEIIEIADENNLVVIEDCAQAHGAEYKKARVPVSSIGCFSFFPGKNLGAFGDAGAVVTDDEEIAEKILLLRDHGRAKGKKYEHSAVGYNARLDTLQAAVLRAKLKHLDEWNEKRRVHAEHYRNILRNAAVPEEADYAKHVYHQFVVGVKNRGQMQNYLRQNGISTGIHYPIPLHQQLAYSKIHGAEKYPVTEKLSKDILSLPIYPELTEKQINYIGEKVNEFKVNEFASKIN